MRRLVAEFLGTALLVAVVVGSGIAASRLSPHDVGLQLLENAAATTLGLYVLILVFGPVSGAHFNPVVTAVEWWQSRGPAREAAGYVVAQVGGGIAGAVLADAMFGEPLVRWSSTPRQLLLSEVVATAGLVLVVFALARTGRASQAPAAVAAYIGAASWFTASASFANPAVTVARAFTDTFAGIAPASVPGFVAAQIVGAALGAAVVGLLFPSPKSTDAVVPHEHEPQHEPTP